MPATRLAALAIAATLAGVGSGWASGDFPLDCHGWEATISSLSGLNTSHARMTGSIDPADVQEYCERVLDDKQKIARCLVETSRQTIGEMPLATADCPGHFVRFQDGKVIMQTRVPAENASCADFLMIEKMYARLCPIEARRIHLED